MWFAALVMMATFLAELGLIPWLSEQMSGAVGGMGWIPAFIILTLVYFYSHYRFASNTAHVAAMYAAFLATAIAVGAPPLFAALVLGFISSLCAILTHYSSGARPCALRRRVREPGFLVADGTAGQRREHRDLDGSRRSLDEAHRDVVTWFTAHRPGSTTASTSLPETKEAIRT